MEPPLTPQLTNNPALGWYHEAKFGLFIHWGIYTVAGVEASWPIMAPDLSEAMFDTQIRIGEPEYFALAQKFNPVGFDAKAWVRAAKDAGMRYIIITAKHHDGFCLFDAPGTDFKITKTPYGKDICLELAQACAEAGLRLGFYYSPPDMHHPGYRDTRKPAVQNWLGEPKRKEWGAYLDYMESHLRKLLTGYGEVSILWFDGLANHAKYDPPRFHQLIHSLSPGTLINDRLGDGYDFITPEQFIPKAGIPIRTGKPPSSNDQDSERFFKSVVFLFKIPGIRGLIRNQIIKYRDGTLELSPVTQEAFPPPERFQPWETCMTMGQSWGYNPHETSWKTPGKLIHNLVQVISRGGNYLLNVGPTERGTFPAEALDRLEYIGRWMKRYGGTVYGSTYTPLQGLTWGCAAQKEDKIYLYIFGWPAENKLVVDTFPVKARSINLLGHGQLEFTQTGQQLEMILPPQAPDPDAPVLEVSFEDPDQNLTHYSPAKETKIARRKYLWSQAKASALINAVLNGIIAFLAYRQRDRIPYPEAAVDILITVAIISFFTCWIAIRLARQEIAKGNLAAATSQKGLRLPQGAALRALLIALACVILFAGLILDGLFFLLAPSGFDHWAYVLIKALYTGASGALASALAIWSVFNEPSPSPASLAHPLPSGEGIDRRRR